MNVKLDVFPPYVWAIVILLLLSQGTWMFLDAKKRGHNYWLWGTLGLIQFPTYLLIYLIFARKIFSKNTKE